MLIGEAKWLSKVPSQHFIYKTIEEIKNKGIPPIPLHPNGKVSYALFVPEKSKHLILPPEVRVIEAKEVIKALQ